MDQNPWLAVATLDEFLYYCCPECELKTKDHNHFYNHAMQTHEKAKFAFDIDQAEDKVKGETKIEVIESKDFEFKAELLNDSLDDPSAINDPKDDPISEPIIDSKDEPINEPNDDPESVPSITKKRKKCPKDSLTQCYFCGLTSTDKEEIRNHVESVHRYKWSPRMCGQIRQYQCSECKVVFKGEEIFKIHICGYTNPGKDYYNGKTKETCPKCDKTFVGHMNLLNHYSQVHAKIQNFQCDICDFQAVNTKTLAMHKKLQHQPEATCELCHKTFKSQVTLKKHHREIHLNKKRKDNNVATCDLCGFKDSYDKLRHHLKNQHPGHKPFQCSTCQVSFPLKYDLRKHEKFKCMSHPNYQPPMCDICGKTFANKMSYNNHMNFVHNVENTDHSLICDVCGKSFLRQSALNDHMKLVHANQETSRDFMCDKCGKGFANLLQLKHHILVHHKQRFFICTICEKIMSYKQKLKEHMIDEHGIFLETKGGLLKEILPCDTCHTKFETSVTLNVHMETDHEMKNREYPCGKCDFSFVSNVLLTAHLMESHSFDPFKEDVTLNKVVQVTKSLRNFKCDICGLYLKSKDTLFCHVMQNHEKDSHTHKCDQCPYTAYRGCDLKQHILRVHPTDKPHKCTECDFASAIPNRLRHHLKRKHNTLSSQQPFPCSMCDKSFSQKHIYNHHMLNEHQVIQQG